MTEMMKKLQKLGIVPVVVLNDAKDALPLAERLVNGGLPCAEVTFRTAAAEESIRQMAKAYPDMIIGAGTVLTCEQADRAIDAGAKFIVSPGFIDLDALGDIDHALFYHLIHPCIDSFVKHRPFISQADDQGLIRTWDLVTFGFACGECFPCQRTNLQCTYHTHQIIRVDFCCGFWIQCF